MADKQPKHSGKTTGKGRTLLPDYEVSEFNGLNTYIKDLRALADGETPDSLNWITGKYKDNISLRRGYELLGTTRNSGLGRISGLGVGQRKDGKQIPFFSYGQKVKYYDNVTDNTIEIGTNSLPAAAASDDVSFMPYQNLAGAFVYLTSPNSSIYKIASANPGNIKDQLSTAYRGIAKIDTSRMFMWQRKDAYGGNYPNILNIGVSDKATLSQYSQTTAENAGTGDGVTQTFTGTLANASGKSTVFNTEFAAPIATGVAITGISVAVQAVVTVASHSLVVGNAIVITGVVGMTQINGLIGFVQAVTPTTITLNINSSTFTAWGSGGTIYNCEYFIDDDLGNLKSNLGGTGTINYATGAFSLTFNTAPQNAAVIEAQYYPEDATSGGVADFTVDGTTTGKGKTFAQYDGGGDIQGVFPFDQVQYCLHQIKSWYLNLTTDDTKAQNLPYRSLLGLPYFRGGYATDDGIVFLDMSNPAIPVVKVLSIDENSATAIVTVVPSSLSDMLDLSGYGFNLVAMFRWDNYDIMACAQSLNGVVQTQNTLMFVRNIYSNQWDLVDYCGSCFAAYNGTLIAGDSLTNNVFTLFSGTDDDGVNIQNHWISKLFDLGAEGLKKTSRFVIKGLIQQTQNIDIFFATDSGSFVKLKTVSGTGAYVNLGNPVDVGSSTVGSNVVGGGTVLTAYPFEVEFTISLDSFEYIQCQFQCNSIGYAQIDSFKFKDNRITSRKVPPAYIG
jgi:hypothetical protein